MSINPSGLCQCGCGEKTRIAPYTRKDRNQIGGEPLRFLRGHCGKVTAPLREKSHLWRGGRKTSRDDGYVGIYRPGHHRASNDGYVMEHILIAEEALGRPLPEGVVLHHHNEDRADNRPGNLVICENNAYHFFLHTRMRALVACGHADWVKCVFCKRYDEPSRMYVGPRRKGTRGMTYHRSCAAIYDRQRRAAKKGEVA